MYTPAPDSLEAARVIHSFFENWSLYFFEALVGCELAELLAERCNDWKWQRVVTWGMTGPVYRTFFSLHSFIKVAGVACFAVAIFMEFGAISSSESLYRLTNEDLTEARRQITRAIEASVDAEKETEQLRERFIEIGPREVPIKAAAKQFETLRRFTSQRFRIAVCRVDERRGVSVEDKIQDEVVGTVNALANVLVKSAGWEHVRQPNALPGFAFPDIERNCNSERINVYTRERASDKTRVAGQALMSVINEAVSDNVQFVSSNTGDNRKYQGQPDDTEQEAVFITVGVNVNAVHPKPLPARTVK